MPTLAERQAEASQRIQAAEASLGPIADSWTADHRDRMTALTVLLDEYTQAAPLFAGSITGVCLDRARHGLSVGIVNLQRKHAPNWGEGVRRELHVLQDELGDRAYLALVGVGSAS